MTLPLQILKFGGSSLGSPTRLRQVLDIVTHEQSHNTVALVVSAFGDTTDHLIAAVEAASRGDIDRALTLVTTISSVARTSVIEATALRGRAIESVNEQLDPLIESLSRIVRAIAEVGDCSTATRDLVLSFGERISSTLIAAALRHEGARAIAIDARSWAVTDARHGDATVLWEPTQEKIQQAKSTWFEGGTIPVHTGFLGATIDGKTTTLGRNGSDYTAALLGKGLNAASVTIWTDVSGVMTADPSIVDDAYPVPSLSYQEGLELAGLGLRMFHPRTMIPLLEAGIPMRIRNAMRPDDLGTRVDAVGSSDPHRPTCIVSLEGMALVDVEGTPRSTTNEIASRSLSALAHAGVSVWFATQAPYGNGVAIAVRDTDAARALETLRDELQRDLLRGEIVAPRAHHPVSLITLVAEAMGKTVNVAGRFFGAVGAIGVNVRASSQGATSRAITCVVDAHETENTVRAIHAAFNLSREQVNVLLLGKGTVGGQFLEQVATEQNKLREQHDLELRLAGLVDSKHITFHNAGIDPISAREKQDPSLRLENLELALDQLAKLPVPVLVDCTAANDMDTVYKAAFSRGIHVVTANKKPLALPRAQRDEVGKAARLAHRGFKYETTVGASLPVIETLKNLVRTGDRVRKIEGSLSGTLGYLSNEVSRGVKLSVAVRAARERGYTEPHPRDDLSGTDAARKGLILARELGLELDLDDVVVEPFVPASLFAHDDVETFLDALKSYDEVFEQRIQTLREERRVLRYLATVDPASDAQPKPSVRVAAVGVLWITRPLVYVEPRHWSHLRPIGTTSIRW
ncbi:MAG: aspartate kinase [Polyangiaceae bacterium]